MLNYRLKQFTLIKTGIKKPPINVRILFIDLFYLGVRDTITTDILLD